MMAALAVSWQNYTMDVVLTRDHIYTTNVSPAVPAQFLLQEGAPAPPPRAAPPSDCPALQGGDKKPESTALEALKSVRIKDGGAAQAHLPPTKATL